MVEYVVVGMGVWVGGVLLGKLVRSIMQLGVTGVDLYCLCVRFMLLDMVFVSLSV